MCLILRNSVPVSGTGTLAVGTQSSNAGSQHNSPLAGHPGTARHRVKLARVKPGWLDLDCNEVRKDIFGGTPDAAKDSQQATITFYSRTAVSMGSLRVPAGMYDLIPVKSPEGWQLEVAQWANVPSPEKYILGSVETKGATLDNLYQEELPGNIDAALGR